MKDNNLLVKQSHLLNNASYKLSSLSMDLIFVMISELKKEDKEFNVFKLSIRDIEKKLNKRINIKSIPEAISDVYKNPFTLHSKDGASFIMVSWVSMFAYDNKNKVITFKFDQQMKEFLLELSDRFVLSHIREVSSLNSEYSKRIFNMIKQWEKVGKFSINLNKLKSVLMVPDSMNIYSNFKQKVLIKSCNQINESTNINVSFEEVKNGRRVVDILFKISKKRKDDVNFKPENDIIINKNKSKISSSGVEVKEKSLNFINNWIKEENK